MSPDYPFDDAATARAVIDAHGTVREWNSGAERLLGFSADRIVGRPAADLLAAGGTLPEPPVGALPRWDGTLPLRHRDGRTVSVWVLAHHNRPDDGSPEHWLVVTPLDNKPPDPADDPLDSVALTQSPCAVAVYDERLRLSRANTAMAEVIGLPEDRLRGLRITEIDGRPQSGELEQHLLRVLETGRAEDFETYMYTGRDHRTRAWLSRVAPVRDREGRVRGVCLAAHDVTDSRRAGERLRLVNEASVRIGTTLDVTRTAQELADVCVPVLADFVSVDLLDPTENGESPPTRAAPVVLRRIAHRSVSPGAIEAVVRPGSLEPYPSGSPQADSLLTGRTVVATVGTPAFDSWLALDRAREQRVHEYGVHSTMSVPITARGLTLGVAVLTRFRRAEPFTRDDVLLAEEVTARAAVCIDNARRYSRERDTALALQRSLLPRTLPRTAAVDAASRDLPAARAGVGGDWFDVIPLSGMRVAMVVGDVVGHGVQASATMGRLRTAVRTLADIDLAPDELLTHLDDLVVRLSAEAGGGSSPGEMGATCIYAVYDPISRRCALARAGHPAPLITAPGKPPELLDLPSGPPLGVGGLPFESAELELHEGTVLAFFTDGLVESGSHTPEAGHALLRGALSARSASLEETCDRVLHTLLPDGGSADDVALLLARTRGLPADQVATWHIPSDPSLVATIRKQVLDQLAAWRLTEASFTAELVVSELVTNAIRYGAHPIRLRLIHDQSTLICEVSDTNHTAPHLRRAKTWDEGGRGLLLVAQLTQRWGSRHTSEGKTIWAEIGLVEDGR